VKTMNGFVDYLEAQLAMMRKDIGEVRDGDIEARNKKMLEWIETNASNFREQWEKNRGRGNNHYAVE